MSRDEKILLGVFALLLFLWASALERLVDRAGRSIRRPRQAVFLMSEALIAVWVLVGAGWWKLLGYCEEGKQQ